MKLSKHEKWILIASVGAILVLYANRANLPYDKDNLNADGDEGQNTINRAISKLKTGNVKVNDTPEEVRKAV